MIPRSTLRRAGMTLIEILVVIAIIGILASLILVGVMAFAGKGPEVKTKAEISQLEMALQNFHKDFGFYPPSKLRLCSQRSRYTAAPSADDVPSIKAITGVWKSIGWASTPIPWDGTTTCDVVLEGDQCLVFFLGGVSVDQVNPMNPNADKKVYYQFNAGRLVSRHARAPLFPSYMDGYGRAPYVYFSSGMRTDGYSVSHAIAGLNSVAPYYKSAGKYHNPTTFQLISAGNDAQFGPGLLWNPPSAVANAGPLGKDDITNFHDKFMGNP